MTARRVIVTLEIETDYPLDDLQRARWWSEHLVNDRLLICHQAQANVVKQTRKVVKKR